MKISTGHKGSRGRLHSQYPGASIRRTLAGMVAALLIITAPSLTAADNAVLPDTAKSVPAQGLDPAPSTLADSLPPLASPPAQSSQNATQPPWLQKLALIGAGLLSIVSFLLLLLWRAYRQLQERHAALQRDQIQQQAILDAIPDLLFEMDLAGRYYECHALRPELLAAPVEAMLGKTVREVMPGEAAETVLVALQVANAKGFSTGKQIRLALENGVRWFELSVARKPVQPGEAPRFIVLSRDITEHKRVEGALGESERHFRSLIESWPDEIARYDGECRRVYINPAMEKTLGSPLLLLGRTPTETYPGSATVDFFERKLREVLNSGQTQDFELQWDYPATTPMWRSLRLVAERDGQGRVVGVFAIARDVTQARQIESVLRESERQFRTLAENLPDNIFRVDRNLAITYVNAQMASTLRVKVQQLIGKPFSDAIDDEELRIAVDEVLETGRPGEIEITLYGQGQLEHYHHVRLVAERSEAGNIIGVLAIGRDITERKRLENDLRVREQYQRALLDNFPFMVWLKDTKSRLLAVNKSYLRAAGLPPDAPYFGLTDLDLFPPESAAQYRADDREVMQSGQRKTVEELVGTPGNMRWHETGKTPVLDDGGNLLGTVGYARDITLQKEAQAALVASEQQFRTLAENAPDNICRYDRDCRILYINPVMERTLQLKLADVVGKRPTELGSFYEDYEARLHRVISTGEPEVHDLVIPGEGAGPQYHQVLLSVERDAYGEIVGALAIGRDITRLKTIEVELTARERQFRTLTENTPDVVARFDPESRFVYCNPHLMNIIGLPEGEILGRTPLETGSNEHVLRCQEKIAEVVRTGKETDMIMILPPRAGRRKVHDHVRFVPEFDDDGHLAYVLMIGRDISELKEAERQLSTLLENLPDSIFRLDLERRYIYVSPSVTKNSGLPKEHFLGKTILDINFTGVTENDRILYEDGLRCGREGIPITREMLFRLPDGERIIQVNYVPERDESGNVISVLTVAREITERKRAEDALAAREREFRTLAENMPEPMVRFDRDLRRVYCNRAYFENAGVAAAQVLGKTPLEYWFVTVPTAEDYMVYLRRVMRQGKAEELVFEIVRGNGDREYQAASLVPEFDADGECAGILTIARDITGIKRMEAMLRKSEQEFRTLAENSPEMIVRYDKTGRCIYINPACERQNGIPFMAASFPTSMSIWKPTLSSGQYDARLKRVIETGVPDQILLEWMEQDDTLVSHEMHAVAEYDGSGNAVGVLVIGHDISALKAAERRLQESRAQLRAMTAQREAAREEERKRIAREIHDELGQLLSVLRLNVTTLDYLFGDNNADLRAKAGNMVTTVDRAISMVRSLATRLRPAVLDAGLGSALEWMVQEFSQSTGIVCDLHRGDEEMPLDVDRAMVVFRIVQESLTNVLRHSGADHVDIVLRRDGDQCEVVVCDNGKGFNPASARRDSFGIVGMRERALMLNGNLEISSGKNRGTTLTVRIPVYGKTH